MRMVAAGLRAGSSGTGPDVKRPVSLTVARANGTCLQSHARRRRAPTVRTAARLWLCPGVLPGVYEPRSAAGTVLHQVVRTHLERFLAETAAATDGVGVPDRPPPACPSPLPDRGQSPGSLRTRHQALRRLGAGAGRSCSRGSLRWTSSPVRTVAAACA